MASKSSQSASSSSTSSSLLLSLSPAQQQSATSKNNNKLQLTGHLIVDLEEANQPDLVDKILKTIPISDLLALRLSHPKCESIIYRQYLNDKTRFEHYIDTLSLYSKIKFRTYAFYDQSINVLETRHPGKFKLQELAEKNLNSRLKRLKLTNGCMTENTELKYKK
jgi:hypothetical protein